MLCVGPERVQHRQFSSCGHLSVVLLHRVQVPGLKGGADGSIVAVGVVAGVGGAVVA